MAVQEVRRGGDFEGAFRAIGQAEGTGLLMLPSPLVTSNLQLLADLCLTYRFPAITLFPEFAHTGGLLAYGPDLPQKRAAVALHKASKAENRQPETATPATLLRASRRMAERFDEIAAKGSTRLQQKWPVRLPRAEGRRQPDARDGVAASARRQS
jgi:hypothetical protein